MLVDIYSILLMRECIVLNTTTLYRKLLLDKFQILL